MLVEVFQNVIKMSITRFEKYSEVGHFLYKFIFRLKRAIG